MKPPRNDKPSLDIAGALPLSPSPETCPVDIRDHYGHYID